MTAKAGVMTRIGKQAVESLAIAIVYIATAQPGFLIAIPPGNVTVVWPPSGVALAAVALLGYRAATGVWLGSFLVNLLFFVSAPGVAADGNCHCKWHRHRVDAAGGSGCVPLPTCGRHATTAWAQGRMQLHGHLRLELFGRRHGRLEQLGAQWGDRLE